MDTRTFTRSTSQDLTILLLIILSISSIATCFDEAITTHLPVDNDEKYKTYIQEQCALATYPSVCLESLSPLALRISKHETILCEDALTAALTAAQNVSKVMKNKECRENIKDSIEYIQDSINALKLLSEGVQKEFQKSNIQTWMSTVITNYEECEGQVKEVQKMMFKASNALFFINKLQI